MRNNISTLGIKKEAVLMLMILIGVAMAAPLLFKEQLVTGTIVNATLIIGISSLGVVEGLLIGLIPSSFALATGLLSPVMAPMVPFIMAGNAILVLIFAYLSKINYWVGVVVGGILKSAFLYGTSSLIISLFINKQVAPTVAQMMGWPQLVTALAGGLVAFGVVKLLKNLSFSTRI